MTGASKGKARSSGEERPGYSYSELISDGTLHFAHLRTFTH